MFAEATQHVVQSSSGLNGDSDPRGRGESAAAAAAAAVAASERVKRLPH